MPINASQEYMLAEREYLEASSHEDKLKCLQKMLQVAPKHKSAEHLLNHIKRQIKAEKEQIIKAKKAGKRQSGIRKEGCARVVLVGLPNAGKSYVLEKLSGSTVEQAEFEFTTREPEVRMIDYGKAKIQAIELPAIYPGFALSERGPELIGLAKNAELVILVIRKEEDVDLIIKELKILESSPKVVLFNGFVPRAQIAGIDVINLGSDIDRVKKEIWAHLRLIRVYTKSNGKVADKPVVLKEGSTVGRLAEIIHKEFLAKFKFARIFGPSAKFLGQSVGLNHVLKDRDAVEIFTK